MIYDWGNIKHKFIILYTQYILIKHGYRCQMKDSGFGIEVRKGLANFSIICHNYSYGGRDYNLEVMDRNNGGVYGHIPPKEIVDILKCLEECDRSGS